METTVKQRLVEFIKSENLSVQKFERIIGVANGYVNNIRKSITEEKLERITNAFPKLNKAWLLFGEGDMIKSNPDMAKRPRVLIPHPASTQVDVMQIIREQSKIISRLLESNHTLTVKLDQTIADMKELTRQVTVALPPQEQRKGYHIQVIDTATGLPIDTSAALPIATSTGLPISPKGKKSARTVTQLLRSAKQASNLLPKASQSKTARRGGRKGPSAAKGR